MFGVLFDLLKKRFRREVRNAGVKAGFGFVALVFAVMGLTGLFVALFFALEPTLGALRAALSVSGVAFALALVASTPLWWPKRRSPPPPDLTHSQLLALASGGGAALTVRQIAIAGVVIALAFGAAVAKPPPATKK